MSDDIEALKAEKARLITEMLDLEPRLGDVEQESAVSGEGDSLAHDHPQKDYRKTYMQKAMRVVELSHRIACFSAL